jgi:hypothetical protein
MRTLTVNPYPIFAPFFLNRKVGQRRSRVVIRLKKHPQSSMEGAMSNGGLKLLEPEMKVCSNRFLKRMPKNKTDRMIQCAGQSFTAEKHLLNFF